MTRITQRCLFFLALTGVLLSTALEITVSDPSESTKSNQDIFSSAPKSSNQVLKNSTPVSSTKSELSSASEVGSNAFEKTDKTFDIRPTTSTVGSDKSATSKVLTTVPSLTQSHVQTVGSTPKQADDVSGVAQTVTSKHEESSDNASTSNASSLEVTSTEQVGGRESGQQSIVPSVLSDNSSQVAQNLSKNTLSSQVQTEGESNSVTRTSPTPAIHGTTVGGNIRFPSIIGDSSNGMAETSRPDSEMQVAASSLNAKIKPNLTQPTSVESGRFSTVSVPLQFSSSTDKPLVTVRASEAMRTSSVALSTTTRESIQLSQNIESSETIANLDRSVSSMATITSRSRIEKEDASTEIFTGPFDESRTSVTFDPNGMTNNYTQDPDSVTFSRVFQVGGPTNGYSSRIGDNRVQSNQSVGGREPVAEIQSSTSNVGDSQSWERDREVTDGKVLADGLNRKEMARVSTVTDKSGTKPEPSNVSKIEDTRQSPEVNSASPQSTESSNEGTSTVSSSTTAFSSKDTFESTQQLQSVVYQTAQSAIRPVTVASPAESLSRSSERESYRKKPTPNEGIHLAADSTAKPDSGSTLPGTSSPIIMSNPAPMTTSANQGANETTVVLYPDLIPESGANDSAVHNSTIAGVAVKTSVSVSLPITVDSKGAMASVEALGNKTTESVVPLLSQSGNSPASSTEPPSTLKLLTTTSASTLKFLKPKLKIGGTVAPGTPFSRRPYQPPKPKPSTGTGPPVSIFNRARTRMASITSSTTLRPFPKFSTIRIQYASDIPGLMSGGELVISTEPVTTTPVPTTTETEEPFSIEPFTEQTQVPIVSNEDDVTLVKVAGMIVVDKGLRWHEQLDNRHSPQYKEKANFVHVQLERLFRTSSIAPHLWKIQIDGFSKKRNSRSVAVDFFMYLIKTKDDVPAENLASVFNEKLKNNTFSRFSVDPSKTLFEFLTEEPLKAPTPPPEDVEEAMIPQWAIAVIVVGAASLIFVILFATVAVLGRHHMRRRYAKNLTDEDSDRPSDWETKMAAAYENLAADTIYDAEDMHSDTYKKSINGTYYGRKPSTPPPRSRPPCRADSWSSSDWSPPPRRPRPQVHRIAY